MELCSRYKSFTCNSCSMHCQIMPEESSRLQYYANSCLCMWPEGSSYFNCGMVEGILTKNHDTRLSGYILVDFSANFLRLFLEKDWIDYLASTDMETVLVSDRNMQSLANYWRKHSSAIPVVIYNDDGLDVTNEKVRQLFTGRYLSFTGGSTLAQMEFTIMGYMISGYNPYQIAEALDMDVRSIYAYKQRIGEKMGGKINELFIRSHSVQHRYSTTSQNHTLFIRAFIGTSVSYKQAVPSRVNTIVFKTIA